MKVYISSTFRDLVDYREEVLKAVDALELQSLNMEDYTAGDASALKKCVKDVKRSAIYIGILGWQYGSIAPNADAQHDGEATEEWSFTRHEYEAAKQARVKCLWFLHEDISSWQGLRDEDQSAVENFRNLVRSEKTTKDFSSASDLRAKVAEALHHVVIDLEERSKKDIKLPSFLPYMLNRSVQSSELAEAIEEHQATTPSRPLIITIEGSAQEEHLKFIERLRKDNLPRFLQLKADDASIGLRKVDWHLNSGNLSSDRSKRFGRLKRSLSDSLKINSPTLKSNSSISDFAAALASERKPQLIYSIIDSDDWSSDDPKIVDEWLSWWGGLPDLELNQNVFIVLCFRYKDSSKKKFFERWALNRKNKNLESQIGRIGKIRTDAFRVIRLSRLEAVERDHVEEWLEEYVKKWIGENPEGRLPDSIQLNHDLKPLLDEFFDSREDDKAHLEDLAGWLNKNINECLMQGD